MSKKIIGRGNFNRFLGNLEFHLLVKSNLKKHMPFLDIKILAVFSFIVFIAAICPLNAYLSFAPSAMILSGFLAALPAVVLDYAAKCNSERVGRKMAELISILNRWYSVKEDIMHAFGMTAASGIGEPLAGYFNEMIVRVNSGMDPCEAIDIMGSKAGNSQFSEFLVNIRQNIRCKGDMKRLLTNMEFQAYKISEEFNRRMITTFRDRIIIYCSMAAVLLAGFFFMNHDARISGFYLDTIHGKMLLMFFMILYAAGTGFVLSITKFKY